MFTINSFVLFLIIIPIHIFSLCRYTSDEFTSVFNEKKQPFSSQSYSEVVFEEPTIEETIVTDHIEYIVDESQNHPDFHTQEVCETMEGEVILEDGTQLKVEGDYVMYIAM